MKKLDGFGMLKGFSAFVVKAKWYFIGIFAALTIACCVMIPFIDVSYDLTSYMPAESYTSEALNVLKAEFDDKGMAYVMVKNVSTEEAQKVSDELAALEGVANVVYVQDMHYKNGSALYTVNLTDYDSTDGAFDAIDRIIESQSEREAYLSGQSAFSSYTRQETENSILKIGIVIVVAIILMLLFTSKSYFELVIMVLVFGVSVALNMGTNILFVGGISYISNLVSLVLQLALSIDYSVILLHRYMECRTGGMDAKPAMETALSRGVIEIFSSSLTTIAGLCSLTLMSLPIGVEIGLSLAKSIVASLVSVIFLMPALLVLMDKPLMKSQHKSFVPNVTKPARAIVKARKVIVPLFVVLIILAGVGQGFNRYSFNYNGSHSIVNAQEHIKVDFGTLNTLVVIVPKGDYDKERELAEYVGSKELIDSVTALSTTEVAEGIAVTDSFSKQDLVELFGSLSGSTLGSYEQMAMGVLFDNCLEEKGLPAGSEVPLIDLLEYVYNNEAVSALLGEYKPLLGQLVYARNNLESENYSRLTFNINSGVESEETFALLDDLSGSIGNYYDEFYMTGESVACYDMDGYFPRDNALVCSLSAVFVLIILLLTFRNIALPIILLMAIQGGIWINFVIPFLSKSPVCFIGYLIITAVQMGATIDYAIVLTNRYQTTKHEFDDRFKAMAAAENTVFPTIITSGVILTITGFTLGLASSGVVAEMGMLLGIGTLTSMLIVLLVLPSLLLVFEKLIDKSGFSLLFKRKKVAEAEIHGECEYPEAVACEEKAEVCAEEFCAQEEQKQPE